ncbi:MAG TPA: FAD/NAD(P)-binding protein [Acidobacteriaceae bacterium]
MNGLYTIAIVGGGVSGTLTAYHLVHRAPQARVVVLDPRPGLGLGLAYSTPSLKHLLNVPAGKISALPDQPEHFLNWVRAHYDPSIQASDFAPRAIFGKYIQSLIAASPRIEHLQTTVLDCHVKGPQATLDLADGTRLVADAVVLATGNFDPAPLPGVNDQAIRGGVYYHSAWEDATYANLPPEAPVILVGTGLTAVDVILRLRETGHRGRITAISRHGVFPCHHAPYEPLDNSVIGDKVPRKAHELLRAVHQAIKAGKPWRAVVDSLRARTNEFWLALPLVEQKRFVRHLQRRWEVVRHRMAPPIADQIYSELLAGTLVKRQGRLHAILPHGEGAKVQFELAGGEIAEICAARVINCTGPAMNYRRVRSSLLNSLFAQGLITAGPLGGGLWSDKHGALRAQDGSFSPLLFNAGPGRQGTLFESIAIPELREQAVALADRLAAQAREAGASAEYPLSAGPWSGNGQAQSKLTLVANQS